MLRAQGGLQFEDSRESTPSAAVLCAEVLRRAAAVRCPTTSRILMRVAADAIAVLFRELEIGDAVEDAFDELVALGELLVDGEEIVRIPPLSYHCSEQGEIFIQGGLPDRSLWLPKELEDRLTCRGAARAFFPRDGHDADSICRTLEDWGYRAIPQSEWLWLPDSRPAADLVSTFDSDLLASPSGRLDGLEVFDSRSPSSVYARRWTSPREGFNGNFVGRRQRRFGGRLWYYVELVKGEPSKALLLPHVHQEQHAWDEARWLHCAMADAGGKPESVVISSGQTRETTLLGLTVPLPGWAERRLCLWGRKLPSDDSSRLRGQLFTFELPRGEVEAARSFLADHLWIRDEIDLDRNPI